jgi:hypothetical protein
VESFQPFLRIGDLGMQIDRLLISLACSLSACW